MLFAEVSESREKLEEENEALKQQISGHVSIKGLVGDDPKFQQVLKVMGKKLVRKALEMLRKLASKKDESEEEEENEDEDEEEDPGLRK